ncbi:collagen alpha-1(I) chain-like [Myiozetetes cayanensis]|uniref:collagen alpha-1(I) chain-like n=1 Tax=Myiozetetes cayanensis TaxID=478635 RepID=UPI00215E45E4|nr:collagen alpha-1(I) chain-like [Myiozetetes cayanensis]
MAARRSPLNPAMGGDGEEAAQPSPPAPPGSPGAGGAGGGRRLRGAVGPRWSSVRGLTCDAGGRGAARPDRTRPRSAGPARARSPRPVPAEGSGGSEPRGARTAEDPVALRLLHTLAIEHGRRFAAPWAHHGWLPHARKPLPPPRTVRRAPVPPSNTSPGVAHPDASLLKAPQSVPQMGIKSPVSPLPLPTRGPAWRSSGTAPSCWLSRRAVPPDPLPRVGRRRPASSVTRDAETEDRRSRRTSGAPRAPACRRCPRNTSGEMGGREPRGGKGQRGSGRGGGRALAGCHRESPGVPGVPAGGARGRSAREGRCCDTGGPISAHQLTRARAPLPYMVRAVRGAPRASPYKGMNLNTAPTLGGAGPQGGRGPAAPPAPPGPPPPTTPNRRNPPPVIRRTVPPMESTWNSPRRRERAGKVSVSVRHRRDEPLSGPGREVSEGAWLPRSAGPPLSLSYRLPRGRCSARSWGGGGARLRTGLGAGLHLLGAVASPASQGPEVSLRPRQPPPVPGEGAAAVPGVDPPGHAAFRLHVASAAAEEALPGHEFDAKHLDTKTYTGVPGLVQPRADATAREPPRSPFPSPATCELPGSIPSGTLGCRCRSSEPVSASPIIPELLGNEKAASRGAGCTPSPGKGCGPGGAR